MTLSGLATMLLLVLGCLVVLVALAVVWAAVAMDRVERVLRGQYAEEEGQLGIRLGPPAG